MIKIETKNGGVMVQFEPDKKVPLTHEIIGCVTILLAEIHKTMLNNGASKTEADTAIQDIIRNVSAQIYAVEAQLSPGPVS